MNESALIKRWTGGHLDELNQVVMRKLTELDGDIRIIRAEVKRQTDEMNHGFDRFDRIRRGRKRPDPRSSERPTPMTSGELIGGEGWTDGRIDDLCRTVSDGVALFDRDLHSLRDEVEVWRGELTARFDQLGRRYRLRRRDSHLDAEQRHPRQTCAAPPAIPPSSPWTDGRLDDFNYRVDVDFARLDCDVEEIKREVAGLQTEMGDRFIACEDARFRAQQWAYFGVLLGVLLVGILRRALSAT